MWTHFWDMHSGGGLKEPQQHIYIEAPEAEARVIFYNRFGHNPDRVSCTCCGPDYSIEEEPDLAQLTGYHRNCSVLETPRNEEGRYEKPDDEWFNTHYYLDPEDEEEARRRGWTVRENSAREIGRRYGSDYGTYVSLEDYLLQDDVLVIRASEISDSERSGEVPSQGYVWVD